MYAHREKVIITDVDGVLVDWSYAFNVWMARHGYQPNGRLDSYNIEERYNVDLPTAQKLVLMFNESAWIRRLPPHRDAIKYVKKLHDEHGFVFHAVTSLTDDEYAQHLRTKNLRELFGETVFERFTYLGCGAPKNEALEEYRNSGCYWVEDRAENADLGVELGLDGLLMNHHYNVNYCGDARKVPNWKKIYNIITGN